MELHFELVETDFKKSALLSDVWNGDELIKASDFEYAMTNELFLFFHIYHMAKHLKYGGCGIKPLIDFGEFMKISVIVPVYKTEKYLIECIESILSQTFKDFELILVDDGSPDNCGKICDDWSKKDSRIVVIHKENGGVSSARNAGLEEAKGEYITFIDSDDYIDNEFFHYAYNKIQEHNADLFVSGLIMELWQQQAIIDRNIYTINAPEIYSPKTLFEDWGEKFPPICMCGPCCKLYKSNIIKSNSISFDQSLDCGEDTYFNLHVLKKVQKIYFSEKIFYHYRRGNEDSLFSRFHKDTYEIHYKVYGKMRQLMIECNCKKQAMLHFENNYFCMLLGGLHEYYRFYDKTTAIEKKELIKKISNDLNIRKLKLGTVHGIKNKILCVLLKCRWYSVVSYLFKRHYKK